MLTILNAVLVEELVWHGHQIVRHSVLFVKENGFKTIRLPLGSELQSIEEGVSELYSLHLSGFFESSI